MIDRDGNQQALFPYNDPGQLPITSLRRRNGEWLRLELELPGRSMWLRAWQAQVGRGSCICSTATMRPTPRRSGGSRRVVRRWTGRPLMQEVVLGIGGWRLLSTLGSPPDVCHLNEGHPALAVLERARLFLIETGQPFDVALSVTRAGNVFTTHTAVAAGFDRFTPALVEQYLGA